MPMERRPFYRSTMLSVLLMSLRPRFSKTANIITKTTTCYMIGQYWLQRTKQLTKPKTNCCSPSRKHIYGSVDTIADPEELVNYPKEFLNSLEPPGLPSHRLVVSIMLLWNLDPPRHCNGTRLIVKLIPYVIEASVLTEYGKDKDVFISTIPPYSIRVGYSIPV